MPSHKKAKKGSTRKVQKPQAYNHLDVRLWLQLATRWNRNIMLAAQKGEPHAAQALQSLRKELAVWESVQDRQVAVAETKTPEKAEWKSSKSIEERIAEMEGDTDLNNPSFDDEAYYRYYSEIAVSMEILFSLAGSGSGEAKGFLKTKAEEFLEVAGKLGWQDSCPVNYQAPNGQ